MKFSSSIRQPQVKDTNANIQSQFIFADNIKDNLGETMCMGVN
jgi:hypothetical protein